MMKMVLLATAVILAGTAMAHAQQTQTSTEVTQSAQQSLGQSRTNAAQFESVLADLQSRNTSNSDVASYAQLRAEISRLEAAINTEQARIRNSLDSGSRVGPEMFNRVQRLMDRHAEKLAELEAFINRS
jgi:uncharacterized protein YabE (DUF348 family)